MEEKRGYAGVVCLSRSVKIGHVLLFVYRVTLDADAQLYLQRVIEDTLRELLTSATYRVICMYIPMLVYVHVYACTYVVTGRSLFFWRRLQQRRRKG